METLLATARARRLHHCYLFEGPPQTGKHSAAVAVAMRAASTTDAVEDCPIARQMAKGLHPDLIQVGIEEGRKSHTISVAQVRELIRQVRLRPYNAAWRTIIVDPVDALMPQAANALLKTLEEPPPDTGFILVTSQSSALLPTVISRSQRVRFRPVGEAELVPWLQARGLAEPERLARLSLGCPGRALALSEGGLAELDEARGRLFELLEGGPGSIIGSMEKLGKGDQARDGLLRMLEVLETLLRDVVLVGCGRGEAVINLDQGERLRRWVQALWPEPIQGLQSALDEARQRLLLHVNNRLVVESLFIGVALRLEGRA